MVYQNLNKGEAVVDAEGFPTDYLMRLLQRRGKGQTTVEGRVDVIEANYVAKSRLLSTTSPLAGGGDLSADRTFSIIDSGVTAGTYTLATITVNAKGLITSASSGTVVGVTDGDKGDITVSGTGTVWTIDNLAVTTGKIADDAVTYAKMQNVSAASRILGRGSAAGAGNAEELTLGAGLSLTGTVLASTITQYTDEMARDALGTALVAGTGITVTPDDGADTITIASTITQYTDEMARDALGTALVAGTDITITVDDGANTITIDSTASGGGGGGSSLGFDGGGNISAVAVKGETAGAAGTGAFTPSTASTGFRAWSSVHAGWAGLVRFEEGSDWELSFSYWDGTTLTRTLYASSTASLLSLTADATATLINDLESLFSASEYGDWRGAIPNIASSSVTAIGAASWPQTGAGGLNLANTNVLTMMPAVQYTSATTANAQSGISSSAALVMSSSTAERGGWTFTCSVGATQLPTGPRFMFGLVASPPTASTEPGNGVGDYACFAKDSTDTNLQFLVNSNSGGGTKVDTGIELVINRRYDMFIWNDAGSTAINALLLERDTGAMYYGTASSDVPNSGTGLPARAVGGLNGTNTGTALIMRVGKIMLRQGR